MLRFVIDPDGAPLAFSKENGYDVMAPVKSKAAVSEKLLASNIDTEGELVAGSKTKNSEHALTVRLHGTSDSEFRQRQVELEQKLNKLDSEGGVLRVIFPDDTHIDWEIRAIDGGERLIDNRFMHHKRSEDELVFICAPFGEGEEELIEEYEGDDWVLECVVPDVGGSAPALARAEIVSPEADIWDLKWGGDSRHYSDAETAEAFYMATDLTPQGGASATTATIEGQAGTPVVRRSLSPHYVAQLSTDIEGVGPMTHEGVFEVLVWVHLPPVPEVNVGEAAVRFEYSVGAGPSIELGEVVFEVDQTLQGKILQLSVGQAFLKAPAKGPHFWRGQVLTRSTDVSKLCDVLGFGLRPLAERRGEVSPPVSLRQPAEVMTREEFDQSPGNLHGKLIAATQGFETRSPGSVVSKKAGGSGEKAWSNPSNAKAPDGSHAEVVVHQSAAPASEYLWATDFGLSVPEGATISAIVAEFKVSSPGAKASGAASLIVSGVAGEMSILVPPLPGTWPTSDTYISVRIPAEMLDGLSPDDVNSEDFGIGLVAATFFDSETVARVAHIRLTPYWGDIQEWATTGDATDIAVESTGNTAQRSEVSDANIEAGRYAIAGTTEFTDVVVGIRTKRTSGVGGSGNHIRRSVLARYADTSNWLQLGIHTDGTTSPAIETVRLVKRVSGTVTELARVPVSLAFTWRHLWLHVDRRGRYFGWGILTEGGAPRLLLIGQDEDLATGGALEEGKCGFYDAKTGASAVTRNYDDFVVWIPSLEGAIFEGLSLELAHDRVEREGQGGGVFSRVPSSGDYLKLAPAGMENRRNRLVFIASPHDPLTMGVGFPVPLKVALYATPRWRTIPDPA